MNPPYLTLINNNLLTFRLHACMHVCSVASVVSISLQPYGLCSPPGSSVQGILQAKILEWVAMPYSRGSSQPKDQTQVSCTAGRFFTTEPPGKPYVHTTCPLLQENYTSIQPGCALTSSQQLSQGYLRGSLGIES